VSTGELEERRPIDDRERARQLGAEFGLGALERVTRSRNLSRHAAWGGLLGVIVALAGGPVVAGVAGGSYTLAVKTVVAILVGGLFAAACALLGVGIARSSVSDRLFRYSGGLVQLVSGEPEPRVARWAEVRDFTVSYDQTDEEPPRLSGFLVTTGTGTRLPGLRGYRRRQELRDLVAEADRNLAPRLIPAMTEEYEAGAAVSFGRIQVSKEGITLTGWSPPGVLIPWPRVKSLHMTYIRSTDGDYVHEIIIGSKDRPTEEISVSGLANGIFLPVLLAYAAGRQGVMVTGYRKEGGGIPSD
jgi:hypothetical protein